MNKIIFIILNLSLFLLISCHSKYIYLEHDICIEPTWDSTGTNAVFVALNTAFKRPVGISRFPDGGMIEQVYSDLSLYSYNAKKNKLTHLTDFNDLKKESYSLHRGNFSVKLAFNDSLIFYNIKIRSWLNVKKDIKEKYMRSYAFNINSMISTEIQSTYFDSLFDSKSKPFKYPVTELNKKLTDTKISDWGIDLKKIYPLTNDEYLDYIIYREGSKYIRQAVIEQIIPGLTKKKQNSIIQKMKDKQQELLIDYKNTDKETDGYQKSLKRTKYLEYSKDLDTFRNVIGLPVISNEASNLNTVIEHLKRYKIYIPDDLEFKEINMIDKDFDIEFKLNNTDSSNIEKKIKWFHNTVGFLLQNGWTVSKQTIFEKPDKSGIVAKDEVSFIWEYTELVHKDKNKKRFLKLSISYGKKNNKNMTLSVSEQVEDQ